MCASIFFCRNKFTEKIIFIGVISNLYESLEEKGSRPSTEEED
jgi:hypothetical protein